MISHVFQSMSETLDYAESPIEHQGKRQSIEVGSSWHGTDTFEQAVDLAREGWLPGEQGNFNAMVESVSNQVREIVRLSPSVELGVVGGAVDVGLYLTGDPECMVDMPLELGPVLNQALVLVVNATWSGRVSTETVLARGVAICALVQVLAEVGVNVEMWVGSAVKCGGNVWQCLTKVKPTSDPIDIGSVAFALAHPSWLRRIIFAAMEHESEEVRRNMGFYANGGYSTPCELSTEATVKADVEIGKLNGYGEKYEIKWVIEKLKECGLEIDND